MRFAVNYEKYTSEDDNFKRTDEWFRPNTYSNYYFSNTVRIVGKNEFFDVVYQGDEEIKVGDKLYLIYAIYDSGDSFGYDVDWGIEFVSIHKDKNIALENGKFLEDDSNGPYKGTIKLDDGKDIEVYRPWTGYFERLKRVEVDQVTVV